LIIGNGISVSSCEIITAGNTAIEVHNEADPKEIARNHEKLIKTQWEFK